MRIALRHPAALATGAALAMAGGPALAHHPLGGVVPNTAWHGLASGIAHPMIGADHLAFLLAVGLLAGLARWGLARPLLFVLASLAGVASAWGGLAIPGAEWAVAASVLGAGGALLAGLSLPGAAWVALLLLAGLAHGQAYAEAMQGAGPTPVLAYLVGLGLLQAVLVTAVAWLTRRLSLPSMLPRVAGMAVLLVGILAVAAQI